jgi:hypothetical protein
VDTGRWDTELRNDLSEPQTPAALLIGSNSESFGSKLSATKIKHLRGAVGRFMPQLAAAKSA